MHGRVTQYAILHKKHPKKKLHSAPLSHLEAPLAVFLGSLVGPVKHWFNTIVSWQQVWQSQALLAFSFKYVKM